MRKMLLAGACMLVLTGCAGKLPSLDLNTTISRNTLLSAESAYGVALSGARTYKALCQSKAVPPSCHDVVARLQAADARVIAAIRNAVAFVRAYPTVDATNVVQAAIAAVGNFQSIVNSTGVPAS